MTEREWRLRRAWPGLRSAMRDKACRARNYIAIVVWIGICAGAWAFVAMMMWQWFVAAPFGLPTINLFEAVGIALVGWVFRELAYGDTEKAHRSRRVAPGGDACGLCWRRDGCCISSWCRHDVLA